MIKMDVNQFLGLPDWRKVELKLTQSKFNSYPIQTEEQELNRRIAILNICAHFAMDDFDNFVNKISQKTLDGLWPTAMELFVTPQSFDILNINTLLDFGYCYCCDFFGGCNKIGYRAIKHSKVTPIYGICLLAKNEKNITKALTRVTPKQRCVAWNPLPMYENIMNYRIKRIFQTSGSEYRYSDYQKDLHTINIFDYFQNRYKA